MKILNPRLEKIAVEASQYPPANLSEIAMAGRSNVGKSSLINAIVQRRALARTSGKPGKTRTINFYNIDDKFRLVDLPGYGYAQVSQSERDKWAVTINTYLESRENLKEVILLVDFRHPPTKDDQQMYEWIIAAGFSGYVLATKSDKVGKSRHQQHVKQIAQSLNIKNRNYIIPVSSETRAGIENVYQLLSQLVK